MTDEQVITTVASEFRDKTFAVTEQYLEVHSPVLADGQIQVVRIDRERNDGLVVAYIPVADEKFFFAVYIDTETGAITSVDTEAWNRVYLRAVSEELTLDELKAFTTLQPTESWSKGDLRKTGTSRYHFSSFVIFPNPEPDEFEDKLKKLLLLLEQDKEGVRRLAAHASACIQVAMKFHNGNGMFGGPHLDNEDLGKMAELGLSINFDLYAGGNRFK